MTTQKACEVLKTHNEWRRGADLYPIPSAKELGEATDIVLKKIAIYQNLLNDLRREYLSCINLETGEPIAPISNLIKLWDNVNNELNS